MVAQEDDKVRELVKEHGAKKWSFISQHLPGRIGKQCRERCVRLHWPIRRVFRDALISYFAPVYAGSAQVLVVVSRGPNSREHSTCFWYLPLTDHALCFCQVAQPSQPRHTQGALDPGRGSGSPPGALTNGTRVFPVHGFAGVCPGHINLRQLRVGRGTSGRRLRRC